jgi:hypothetical protein
VKPVIGRESFAEVRKGPGLKSAESDQLKYLEWAGLWKIFIKARLDRTVEQEVLEALSNRLRTSGKVRFALGDPRFAKI